MSSRGGAESGALVERAVAGSPPAIAALDERLAHARAENDVTAVDGILSALALRAAEGSRPALDLLLAQIISQRLAHPAIRRLVVDPGDVDDAVQETLEAVARGITTFEGRARFTTWLYRVAQNATLRLLQRNARGGIPTEDLPEPALQPGALRRMSSLIATRRAVELALDKLPAHYREPLVLRELHQRSYEEIGRQLHLPIGTVRSRIARARQLVAEDLQV